MFRRSEVLLLTIILLSGLVTKSIAQVAKISPTNVAIGVETVNVHTALHATKGALLFQGTSGQTPISGEGNRFMWIPFKAAFRAGQVSNTQWDAEHIGFFSFVGGGQNNMASGYAAFIGGGNNNTALADHSFIASGTDNMASGETSFIGGGTNNKASGTRAFVGGGLNNEASNELTFVGGGYGNKATGLYSIVASGENNQSAGRASFVGGGESNQTEGIFTFIGGGISNAALGDHSFVGGGRGNTAYSYCEAVFGSFPELDFDYEKDIWKSGDRLFVIANGISKANRSNALTVLKSGYVGFNEKNPDTRLHIKQEASQPQEGLRIEGFYNLQDSTDTYWDIWNAGDDL